MHDTLIVRLESGQLGGCRATLSTMEAAQVCGFITVQRLCRTRNAMLKW